MIKLLLLSSNPEAVSACRKTLQSLGIECEWTSKVSDMRRWLVGTPFNGLIFDVLTAARTSPVERALLQEFSDYYPTLMMRWNSASRKVRGLVFGEILDKEDPLGDFVGRFCQPDRALVYRKTKRFNIHLNVLLSPKDEFTEQQVEKTVTLNLSRGGCFIISSRNWQHVEHAWIRLPDLADPTPIGVEVCQYLPWGEQKQIPGIGVKFTELQPDQQRAVDDLCEDFSP